MQLNVTVLFACILLISAGSGGFSQVPGDSSNRAGWPGTLILPKPGVPLSLEVVESEVLAGAPQPPLIRKICRDMAGRTRLEPFSAPSSNSVQLLDPVKGMLLILERSSKVAHRMWFPKAERGGERGASFSGLIPSSGQTEKLGTQIIDGIEYEGVRVTISKDVPSEAETIERWFSNELGLIGLTSDSGPDWERTARVQKVERAEPDPMLFEVPPEYTIRDLNSPEN
jgi:hypothetical protein